MMTRVEVLLIPLHCCPWELNSIKSLYTPSAIKGKIQVLQNIFIIGEGTEMINPALSCKKIKLEFRLAKTGYYWVHLKTDSIRVFCDMDTSGGESQSSCCYVYEVF